MSPFLAAKISVCHRNSRMGRTKANILTTLKVAQRAVCRLVAAKGSFSTRRSRRDRPSAILAFATASVLTASVPAFADGCKLTKIVEFPITMVGMRPLMTASINDVDVQFVVDSGAFFSMISAASAAQLKLKTSPAPLGLKVTGVHGTADFSIATVKTFALAGVHRHSSATGLWIRRVP